MNRFQFSIIIPGDIAPHDGFKSCPGRIKQDVYAEISGLGSAGTLPAPNTYSVPRYNSTSPPGSSTSLITPDRITPYSPKSDSQRTTSSSSTAKVPIPDGKAIQATRLQGIVKTSRRSRVRYNPNQDGGFSKLDDRSSGYVPGIGINELQMISDVVSLNSITGCTNNNSSSVYYCCVSQISL
jgi:hypothetical protein